jgi:subtilase family serine protease
MLRSSRSISAHFKRSLLAGGAVVAVALGTFALAAPGSGAAIRPMTVPGSVAPQIPAGAARLGTLAAGQQVSAEVTLNLRNQARLSALLNGQADPASPYYGRYLSTAQFDAAFGPTADQVTQVENALRAAGLTPGQASADRLSIPVTGTAAQVQRAFGTTLATYRLAGGRVAFANTSAPQVQAGVAPLIQGVIGLDDLFQAHSMMSPKTTDTTKARALMAAMAAQPAAAAGLAAPAAATAASAAPRACPSAVNSGFLTFNGFFAPHYGLSQLYSLGDFGAGAKVAILELEPNSASDVATFKSCYGLTTPVSVTLVDGGLDPGTPDGGEAALDIEIAAALAPQAALRVYQGPNSAQGFFDLFNHFAAANTEKTMSDSYGGCEADAGVSFLNALETVFKKSAAQGQTVLAASGDSGSNGCAGDGGNDARLSADFPGDAPFVTAVGGTSVPVLPNGNIGEVVWNDSNIANGASGGGVSNVFCMPDYQYQPAIPGLINSRLKTNAACKTSRNKQGFRREIPDVSADADPQTGYGIFWDGQWQGFGGTSASAPLWAAIAALTDVSSYCRDFGAANPGARPTALYAAVARLHSFVYNTHPNALRDVLPVTTISNGHGGTAPIPTNNAYRPSGYTGSLYPVTTGDDIATGLGVPIVKGTNGSALSTYNPGYTAMVCQQVHTRVPKVTGVSPSSGKANTAVKVAIKGSGFLTTAGAMRVRVYHGATVLATLTPACTQVACTVTVPREPAMTVDLRVSAEMGGYTPAVAADRYRYA